MHSLDDIQHKRIEEAQTQWLLVSADESDNDQAPDERQSLHQGPTSTPVVVLLWLSVVKLVLDNVGGNLFYRDAVDERIVDETRRRFYGDLRGRMPNYVGPNNINTPPDCKDFCAEAYGIIICSELEGTPKQKHGGRVFTLDKFTLFSNF
jgi:hypothetical protein